MKRLFALLLTLAVVWSFSACVNEQDVRGDQIDNNPSADSATSPETEDEFSLGAVDGLTYENKFIGLGCNLAEGWSFYSDEQIKELNNITTEIAGEEYAEAIKDAAIIYDMYATSSNQIDNINVNLEKLNILQLAALDISDNYEKTAPTILQTYENMGYTNINYEIGTVKIDGKDFACMNITSEISGIKMYQTLFSIKCSGYLANVAITTYQENMIDDIIHRFYLIK